MRDLFLDATSATAAILPRIVPIGDMDEDEVAFAQAATGASAATLDLPRELGGLEQRMLLAQLVLKWAGRIRPAKKGASALVASNPASALALADDLARLMDDMTTRGVRGIGSTSWCPSARPLLAAHPRIPEDRREAWPEILAERGVIEPAARRDA